MRQSEPAHATPRCAKCFAFVGQSRPTTNALASILPSERAFGDRVPSFVRLGSWIGGDRDGNPFVTADSLRTALARASEVVLGHYLDQLHALGAELSISSDHADVDADVIALAEASGDTAPSRADEPYRRALSGIYARVAATHVRITGGVLVSLSGDS